MVKPLGLITNTILSKVAVRRPTKKDILFLGDYADLKGQESMHFKEIQHELRKKKKFTFAEIYFPTGKFKEFKKLKKDQTPFERFLKVKDVKGFKKNAAKKEFEHFVDAIKMSKAERYALGIIYNTAKRVLARIKPNIIVLTTYYTSKYPFIIAAKELGIPAIEIQHGNIRLDNRAYVLPKKYQGKLVLPDYFVVSSQKAKDILTQKSIYTKGQVQALGYGRFDKYASLHINKQALLKKHGIPKGKKILHFKKTNI